MLLATLPAVAQYGVVQPLHIEGNQFKDPYGNRVVLHGVMETPSPYFNKNLWGYACNDGTVSACLNFFEKIITGCTSPAKGTYCNLFRLHLDPCWTNDPNKTSTGSETGEANISRFSSSRLEKYMKSVYWPIAQKALNHGMYVIMRPPGVCPKSLKVGDYYQQYLKTVWGIVAKNSNVLANQHTVMIELANEPVNIYNASGQTSATAMRDYFQPVINVIRAAGYKGIILVPGTGWQSNYKDYANYPVSDSNYAYAVHDYPGWYGTSDTSYDHNNAIKQFHNSVPVVDKKPIVITEVDWSPEKAGAGHYDEHGNYVVGNYGTWATATTSKWGQAFKAVCDHYGISFTLSGTKCYIDMEKCAKNNVITGAFGGMWEACSGACMAWFKEWSKKDYAHASGSTQTTTTTTPTTTTTTTTNVDLSGSLIKAWTKGNDRPAGWACNDAGTYPATGTATSGPRVMQFTAGGDFKYGFYVRQQQAAKSGYIEYGSTSGYSLAINNYGNYCLTFNCAAWKGTPYLKAEVYTAAGNVIASTIVQCTKNMNGSTTASTSGSNSGYLSFYCLAKGNYRLRFTPCKDAQGSAGDWLEAIVANVNLRYLSNPLAFKTANTVPSGWKIVDGGNTVADGNATSGPRTFHFPQGGKFDYGLYIRSTTASTANNYAEVGSRWGYAFTLLPGSYTLTYNAVAWSGTPYVKCEILTESGSVVGSSTLKCSVSVNKSTNASTASAPQGTVNFTIGTRGNYRLRFTPVANASGAAAPWLEAVVGHIKVTQNSGSRARNACLDQDDNIAETTAIDAISTTTQQAPRKIYNAAGIEVQNARKAGLYIIGGKKVYVK